jgi:hypothetical protein
MPYLQKKSCKDLRILPGAILSGEFASIVGLIGPHQEDENYSALTFEGPASSEQFKGALRASLHESVEKGFAIELAPRQKHVPIGHAIDRSIVTIQVDPKAIAVVEDSYNPGKTKIHFVDQSGREFSYFPITDLGFHTFADSHRASSELPRLNRFINAQPEAYLRIGLSRAWDNGTANGYWLQVNGVYTFPDYFKELRCY